MFSLSLSIRSRYYQKAGKHWQTIRVENCHLFRPWDQTTTPQFSRCGNRSCELDVTLAYCFSLSVLPFSTLTSKLPGWVSPCCLLLPLLMEVTERPYSSQRPHPWPYRLFSVFYKIFIFDFKTMFV